MGTVFEATDLSVSDQPHGYRGNELPPKEVVIFMNSTQIENGSKLSTEELALLFGEARTANTFSEVEVPDSLLHSFYENLKYGPTAMNGQPLRIKFLKSTEAKARLLPFMSEGNRAKTATAAVVAIMAADGDFNENLPQVFPHMDGAKDAFGGLESRKPVAEMNASIQIGYAILLIRALGLAAGPMTGFDHDGVDEEFFAGTNVKSLAVINIGYPGEGAWMERLPRLSFEQVAEII